MTPEGRIKKQLDSWMTKHLPGAFRYRVPGGMFGQSGMGDYFIVYCGTPIMIEVKADLSCTATDLQMKRLSDFIDSGGIGCVLKGFQEEKLWAIKEMCEIRSLRESLNTPNSGRHTDSDEYATWYRTKHKCTDPKFKGYEVYGAIGITMCDEWLNDFYKFYDDMGPKPTCVHTLDRIDPSGNYEPSNCRWADKSVQANNRLVVNKYTYKGVTGSLTELARQFSAHDPKLVYCRVVQYGWPIHRALVEPLYGGNRYRK